MAKILIFELSTFKCIYQIINIDVHDDLRTINKNYIIMKKI